ncbi:MAG: hypothetical protein IKV61_01665 [Clostridia bacterium]|nr:hypothetical protein [Clostridia bacterium]
MVYQVVTAICLAVLVFEVLLVVISILTKNREERILFIRSFKKGKCAIIYFTAIPLYCMAHLYNGENFISAFFMAIPEVAGLVVLKYDFDSLLNLMSAFKIYEFTIYFCFVLIAINAIMFALSLTAQHIWNFINSLKNAVSKKDELILIGNNEQNLDIYTSDSNYVKSIIDNIKGEDSSKLYLKNVVHFSVSNVENYIKNKFDKILAQNKKRVVIINTGNDENNMLYCRYFISNVSLLKQELKEKVFERLKIFVFGDSRFQTIYDDIVHDGFGTITFVNKYQKVAMDFINNYPLSLFMNEEQIDYKTAYIKPDVNVNVCFIGFGKTSQQIFLTSVANNQFITEENGSPVLKQVNYHIFDKNNAQNNKNLNHSYYRFKNEVDSANKKEYLELPKLPANETYYGLDINDTKFYVKLKEVLKPGSKNCNYVVIAFGSDLENIDLAQKIIEKRKEWNLTNLNVFVKVRKYHKEQTLLEQDNCYFIGNEKKVVYNIDKILEDKIQKMAKLRDEIYELEYNVDKTGKTTLTQSDVAEIFERANKNWYTQKSQLERESSLYCCLSLRSKLHMLGLDYADNSDSREAVTEKEFLEIYANGDMPNVTKYKVTANGKKIVFYPLELIKSKRYNLAVLEHLRWNSFMISKGVIPATKEQILSEQKIVDGIAKFTSGKNYGLRRHGNLTTFEGLIDFRKMVAERDKVDEIDKDVIKYDYQILDDAYWLLTSSGKKIVRK